MGPDTPTGKTLWDVWQNPDDKDAWARFVDRYTPVIYGWCCQKGLQDADAQDVTQEILFRLAGRKAIQKYDQGKGRFRPWLCTVVRNAIRDFFRDGAREAARPAPEEVQARLESVEAQEELVGELRTMEIWEQANASVQAGVSPRDWDIYQRVLAGKAAAPDDRDVVKRVAGEAGVSTPAAYQVCSRVKAKLEAEVKRLSELDFDTVGE